MAVIVLAAIVCCILLQGFIEAQMAIDAARNLRVRFAGFEHGEVRDGRLYVDTLLIFKNRRPYDVEIDGGSCNVFLDWGSGYRLIGYGSLHYGLVKGGSESVIPVRLVIDLSWLPKNVADWISSGGKIGGNFTNVRFRIDLVLRIPVKVLGVRVSTDSVRLTYIT